MFILQMMISFPNCIQSTPQIEQTVKDSVDWMMTIQQTNGNTPPTTEGQDEEDLVHWCHGAPGVVYMYIRAYRHWQDDKYLQAALKYRLAWSVLCKFLFNFCSLLKMRRSRVGAWFTEKRTRNMSRRQWKRIRFFDAISFNK